MMTDRQYKAALVVIGNEILSGRTQDKNINYVAVSLGAAGVSLAEVRVIPDIEGKIIAAVNELRAEFDYVFTCGGIGPTHDDITASCIAKAFGVAHEIDPRAFAILEAHYGAGEFTPARQRMAMIPKGADLIPNPVSAAPGFIIGNVYVMAGVPRIMQAMLDHVVQSLKGGAVIQSRTVTSHTPESAIAIGLGEIQDEFPQVEIGSYPFFQDGKVGVSVVLRGVDEDSLSRAENAVAALVESLQAARGV